MSLARMLASLTYSQPNLWFGLANQETSLLKKKLQKIELDSPIYVCGLARAGTTITLEAISEHLDVATHSYRDFPMMFTPFFWNKLLGFFDRFSPKENVQERSHKDGIMVSSKSPEAMEEIVWMAFFSELHSLKKTSILADDHSYRKFEKFYVEHIKKLLLFHAKSRYASKANYNISRIGYLNSIFKDPKFIIIVRDPVTHIRSLMDLHERFCNAQKKKPSTLKQMNLSGHFEFGLNRKLIVIDENESLEIEDLFNKKEDLAAWCKYWSAVYGHVIKLSQDPKLKDKIKFVRHEDLCANSSVVLKDIFQHCRLENAEDVIEKYSSIIKQPADAAHNFSETEIINIRRDTKEVAEFFDYK